jgi:hypothetical protein
MVRQFGLALPLALLIGMPALAQSVPGTGFGATPLTPGGGRIVAPAAAPAGAAGLCQCLPPPDASPFDRTSLHLSCLGTLYGCQSACNTNVAFSYIPDARHSCPARPEEETGRIAGLLPITAR